MPSVFLSVSLSCVNVASETAVSTTSLTFKNNARSSAASVSSLNTVTDSSPESIVRPTWCFRNVRSGAINPFLHFRRNNSGCTAREQPTAGGGVHYENVDRATQPSREGEQLAIR